MSPLNIYGACLNILTELRHHKQRASTIQVLQLLVCDVCGASLALDNSTPLESHVVICSGSGQHIAHLRDWQRNGAHERASCPHSGCNAEQLTDLTDWYERLTAAIAERDNRTSELSSLWQELLSIDGGSATVQGISGVLAELNRLGASLDILRQLINSARDEIVPVVGEALARCDDQLIGWLCTDEMLSSFSGLSELQRKRARQIARQHTALRQFRLAVQEQNLTEILKILGDNGVLVMSCPRYSQTARDADFRVIARLLDDALKQALDDSNVAALQALQSMVRGGRLAVAAEYIARLTYAIRLATLGEAITHAQSTGEVDVALREFACSGLCQNDLDDASRAYLDGLEQRRRLLELSQRFEGDVVWLATFFQYCRRNKLLSLLPEGMRERAEEAHRTLSRRKNQLRQKRPPTIQEAELFYREGVIGSGTLQHVRSRAERERITGEVEQMLATPEYNCFAASNLVNQYLDHCWLQDSTFPWLRLSDAWHYTQTYEHLKEAITQFRVEEIATYGRTLQLENELQEHYEVVQDALRTYFEQSQNA